MRWCWAWEQIDKDMGKYWGSTLDAEEKYKNQVYRWPEES